jgi:sporulation protein YlmC with PRC-barrel domain
MLQSVNDLKGTAIHATDGDIGKVADFLFDDESWAIRYLVVDTGKWLPGRKVLISPISIDAALKNDGLRLSLTKDQIKNSPPIDADKPVSRQYESEYLSYYGYPYYWYGAGLWGASSYPQLRAATPISGYPDRTSGHAGSAAASRLAPTKPEAESRLRSTTEVTGYYIEASDGDIGHVENFLVDDKDWALRYTVVDTVNWWPGKKVVVSPDWISQVSWAEAKVHVNLSRQKVKDAPEYDPSAPISRDYEERLYDSYGSPKYWQAPRR